MEHKASVVTYNHKTEPERELHRGECSCGARTMGFNHPDKAQEWVNIHEEIYAPSTD